MPRPVRVEFAGVVYHVTARGNERREFYRDDKDRRRFLEALGGAVEQFGVVVHVYVYERVRIWEMRDSDTCMTSPICRRFSSS